MAHKSDEWIGLGITAALGIFVLVAVAWLLGMFSVAL
jgi:hypothetical protein